MGAFSVGKIKIKAPSPIPRAVPTDVLPRASRDEGPHEDETRVTVELSIGIIINPQTTYFLGIS